MSTSIWSALTIITTAIGGLIAWLTVHFIGAPIRKFWDLRGEVRQQMHEYANVRVEWVETEYAVGHINLSMTERGRLTEAEQCFRNLAARVKAFGETEVAAALVLRLFRIDAAKASAGLFGMSNSVGQPGKYHGWHTKAVEAALRFRTESTGLAPNDVP